MLAPRVLLLATLSAVTLHAHPGLAQARLAGEPQALEISPSEAERLRSLEADLAVLADLGSGDVLDGSLSLELGAGLVTAAVLLDEPLLQAWLGVTGAIAASRGSLRLLLGGRGDAADGYDAMPLLRREDLVARLSFGEAELERLARRTRRARFLDGAVLMAGGASFIPAYVLLARRDDAGYRFGEDAADWLTLGLSSVSFGAGVLTMFQKTDAERRWRAYQRDHAPRRAAARRRRPAHQTWALHAAPLAGGLALLLRGEL